MRRTQAAAPLPAGGLEHFDAEGYVKVAGLLDAAEVDEIAAAFRRLHERGEVEGCFRAEQLEDAGGDILKAYPRMMQPHRVDGTAKHYLLHPKLETVLRALLREEPLACQSMFYFKPPGARGQALHQDNFFLKVAPGTCIAAWMAIDPADERNGGLFVVPGTGQADILCAKPTARTDLFAYVMEVEPPPGQEPIPVRMQAGDVLFFNGSLIHGSYPNTTSDRFRRSLIGHYCGVSALQVGRSYRPLVRFDGSEIERETAPDDGPCA